MKFAQEYMVKKAFPFLWLKEYQQAYFLTSYPIKILYCEGVRSAKRKSIVWRTTKNPYFAGLGSCFRLGFP